MHSMGGTVLVIMFGEEIGTRAMLTLLLDTLSQRGTKLIHGNLVRTTEIYLPYSFLFHLTLFLPIAYAAIGNELSGKGIGASVGPAQYGKDLIHLKQILDTLYEGSRSKPALVAPGGFYAKDWYDQLLQVSGSGIINVMTHHIYNLGAGLLLTYQNLLI